MAQSESRSLIVGLIARIYGASLILYAYDLRTEFGQEMVDIFEDQMRGAWRERGISGLLDVWTCVGTELLRIALPRRLAAISIPALGFVISVILFAVVSCAIGAAMAHLLSPSCAKTLVQGP